MRLIVILTGLLGLTATATAAVPNYQGLDAIEAAVSDYVARHEALDEDSEFSIGRLDPRLRLARCDVPLTAQRTGRPGPSPSITVEVRCPGSKPWVLYVPVSFVRYADVVVARRAVARGAVIDGADLAVERREIRAAAAAFVAVAAVAGQVATRALRAGEALTERHVRKARLVKRGDRLVLISKASSIRVRMAGTALEGGGAGDRIRARNLSSERIVEGILNRNGELVIGG